MYLDKDVGLDVLKYKVVTVVGYGSQGRAQALNLRDSGIEVIIGVRQGGRSWGKALEDEFKVMGIAEAVREGDIVLMLIPDMVQPEVYRGYIEPNLREGMGLCFAHGFNIHYKLITPPEYVDVFMVAPKAPGPKVRETFLNGFGVPALVAVYQNHTGKAFEYALAIAKGIGCTRAGVIGTTFKEETETDLIGEQCVLVGGLIELIKKGFEVLVELGYQPEVAYFEVLNEAKLIMDLIYESGLTGMLRAVSDTAKYGGLTVGPLVIDDHVKENMKKAASRVINGEFTNEWLKEYSEGTPKLKALMKSLGDHLLEVTGNKVRKLIGLEE